MREVLLQQYDKPKRGEVYKNYQPEEFERSLDDGRYIPPAFLEYLKALSDEEQYEKYPGPEMDEPSEPKIHFTERYNTPDAFRSGYESRDYADNEGLPFEEEEENERNPKSFSRNYNTPDNFRNGFETRDIVGYPDDRNPVFYLNQPNSYSPEERELVYENFQNDENLGDGERVPETEGHFTEGGMIYLKGKGKKKQKFVEINSNKINF